MLVVGQIEADADLIKLATAVNKAKTPHGKKSPPGLALVVLAELDKESAAAALKALAKVKGVNRKGTTANVKKGQISIKLQGLDGSSGAKLKISDILTALKKAGIKCSLTKK